MGDPALGEIFVGAFAPKVQNRTVNAGHKDFTGANNAEIVDAAIQFANSEGYPRVVVDEDLTPYSISNMPNGHLASVRVVRSGQILDAHDPIAYGATGDGSADDTPPLDEAFGREGLTILPPGNNFRFTSQLTVARNNRVAGMGGMSQVFGAQAPAVLTKDGSFGGVLVESGGVLEYVDVQGASGNGGDGVILSGARATARYVKSSQHGQDGFRVGQSGENTNLWQLERIISLDNGRHGCRIHDPDSPPNAGAGTMLGADLRSNGGDGLNGENSIDNTLFGVTAQANAGHGFDFLSGWEGHQFYGCYSENNTGGEVRFQSGADKNLWLDYRGGVADDGITDNGANNLILGRENDKAIWRSLAANLLEVNKDDQAGRLSMKQTAAQQITAAIKGTSGDADLRVGHDQGGLVKMFPHNGSLQMTALKHLGLNEEIASAPSPSSGEGLFWLDSDNGDLNITINHGGTTKTATVVDFSAV